MHIEIDVMELIVLIFFYTLFKWLFRGVIVILFIRVLEGIKRKGQESIETIKNKFSSANDNEGDLEN